MSEPPTPDPGISSVPLHRYAADGTHARDHDDVAVEEPLELRVEGRSIAVAMRTPGHDQELAAGFLWSEGVVSQRRDIFEFNPCAPPPGTPSGNVIDVLLARPQSVNWDRLTRHVFSASSCGICGKATIEAVHLQFPPIEAAPPAIGAALLATLPEKLAREQTAFRRSGGLHAAALFDGAGNIVVLREDVGRHNAADKVLGHALLNDVPRSAGHVLLVSGRVSFEIMQKALAARIAVVAGISAPTSLAVEFARASGQTLAAFVRDGRFNLYTGSL